MQTISKSKLESQLTQAFNKAMGAELEEAAGIESKYTPAEDYLLRIDITQERPDMVKVYMGAEVYFDHNDFIDYGEYKSIIREIGETPMSKDEYYKMMYDAPTMQDKMNKVIQQYNPDWYFELYDSCSIAAWLDDCKLEA